MTGASVNIQGFKQLQRTLSNLAVLSRSAATQEVRAGILLIQGEAKKITARTSGRGRVYVRRKGASGYVEHRASAPGDPPAKDTGRLGAVLSASDAIRYEHGGLTATFGPRNYPVAAYLEFGTRTMVPRPFLFRSLETVRPKIQAGFERAIRRITRG